MMKKYKFIISLVLLVSVLFIWWLVRPQSSTAKINGHTFYLDVVADEDLRAQGLSGRSELADDRAMLFIFPEAKAAQFWMKGMNFPIDLLWLQGDKVVGYEKNMQVPKSDTADNHLLRYYSPVLVDRVLEFSAGSVDRLGIRVGDIINIHLVK